MCKVSAYVQATVLAIVKGSYEANDYQSLAILIQYYRFCNLLVVSTTLDVLLITDINLSYSAKLRLMAFCYDLYSSSHQQYSTLITCGRLSNVSDLILLCRVRVRTSPSLSIVKSYL